MNRHGSARRGLRCCLLPRYHQLTLGYAAWTCVAHSWPDVKTSHWQISLMALHAQSPCKTSSCTLNKKNPQHVKCKTVARIYLSRLFKRGNIANDYGCHVLKFLLLLLLWCAQSQNSTHIHPTQHTTVFDGHLSGWPVFSKGLQGNLWRLLKWSKFLQSIKYESEDKGGAANKNEKCLVLDICALCCHTMHESETVFANNIPVTQLTTLRMWA